MPFRFFWISLKNLNSTHPNANTHTDTRTRSQRHFRDVCHAFSKHFVGKISSLILRSNCSKANRSSSLFDPTLYFCPSKKSQKKNSLIRNTQKHTHTHTTHTFVLTSLSVLSNTCFFLASCATSSSSTQASGLSPSAHKCEYVKLHRIGFLSIG